MRRGSWVKTVHGTSKCRRTSKAVKKMVEARSTPLHVALYSIFSVRSFSLGTRSGRLLKRLGLRRAQHSCRR